MTQIVFVIDDDDVFRDAIHELLSSVGLTVECFAGAAAFIDQVHPDARGCILIDVRMPGINGLELQQRLAADGTALPLIFVTGHGDLKMGIAAMKLGAFDFLTKPVREQDLIDVVQAALAFERDGRAHRMAVADARRAYATLDAREEYVMGQVVLGQLNKTISARLGLSEIMVKLIRRRLMKKMGATSLADLVHAAHLIKGP